ncbi:FAD-dependent monooxygenase [Candidatus Pelagibacter sp. Uisw_134_02]|uniref:FAD-dependent monooxygenase n=1 Tax=Candidatus Pelagibacter sp. Uisw_134_02 TaxID=3230990 RepID=UPI0039E7C1D9
MNICIIGDGLTSLSLAKNLINKKINVHFYHKNKIENLSTNRTIGISKDNLKFFRKEIYMMDMKFFWEIKKIEVYSEKLGKENLLNFENEKNNLFYMLKNNELYSLLINELSKSKYFKKIFIKNKSIYINLQKKYDLIINCESKNLIAKKYFSKTIKKNYHNLAYTTIIKHNSLKNNTAIQIFTKYGPIAYLPISNVETSVVYSLDIKQNKFNKKEITDLIKNYNPKFTIKKIYDFQKFELNSSSLRNYYHQNIVAFGDCLHKIHPLAGQGFNMTIRDIKIISSIIQNKIDLGMQLDTSIFSEFEKKTKHLNFIFSSGVDFIYEFFNLDKKFKYKGLNRILKVFGKNKKLNKTLIKYADKGLNF